MLSSSKSRVRLKIVNSLKCLFPTLEQLTCKTSRSQQEIEDEIDRKFSSAWNSNMGAKKSEVYTYNYTEDAQMTNDHKKSYLDDSVLLGPKKINASSSRRIPRLVIRSDIFV